MLSVKELKSFLMKVKEESDKAGLKLNIQKMKIMASGSITSWKIGGETMEIVAAFIFLGSEITADGVCGNEIKRHLLLGRKARTNLDSILKTRDITLPNKGPYSQSYGFSSKGFLWDQIKKIEYLLSAYSVQGTVIGWCPEVMRKKNL